MRSSVDNLLEVERNGYKYVDQVSGKLQCSMCCIGQDRALVFNMKIGLNERWGTLPLNSIALVSFLLPFFLLSFVAFVS